MVTQSPRLARITRGCRGSSWSPLLSIVGLVTAALAKLIVDCSFWSSTYMNPNGSWTPNRLSVIGTLTASTLYVRCGAVLPDPHWGVGVGRGGGLPLVNALAFGSPAGGISPGPTRRPRGPGGPG